MAGGMPFSREALPRSAGHRKAFVAANLDFSKGGVLVGLQLPPPSADALMSHPATRDVILNRAKSGSVPQLIFTKSANGAFTSLPSTQLMHHIEPVDFWRWQ